VSTIGQVIVTKSPIPLSKMNPNPKTSFPALFARRKWVPGHETRCGAPDWLGRARGITVGESISRTNAGGLGIMKKLSTTPAYL
jgi:hypothetical protein